MANETKVKITAETAQAESAMRTLGQSVDGMSRKFFDLSGVAAGLTGALSVTAFAGFIKGTIDAADSMNDLAAKTGISVEILSTYKLLAEQNGTTIEGMAGAMKHLSVTMAEHPDYLAKIGVATKDSEGKTRSLSVVMKDVAEKFSGYKDGAEKVALAQAMFGKSGMDMIPVLNQGAAGFSSAEEQAKKYGFTLSSDFAAAADSFNDKISLIEMKATGLGQVMAGPLLKSLNDVADAMLATDKDESFKNFMVGSALGITEFVRVSVIGIKTLIFAFHELGIMVNTVGLQLAAMAKISTIGDVGKIGREGMQRMADVRDQYNKDVNSMAAGSFVFGDPQLPNVGQNGNKPMDGRNAPKVTPNSGKNKKTDPFKLENEAWVREKEFQIAQLEGARKNDEKAARDHARAVEEANRIIYDVDPIKKLYAEWQRMQELQAVVGKEMLPDADIAKAYDKMFKDIDKSGNDAFKSLENAIHGWGDAFTDEMTKMVRTGKMDFKSLADSIINDLIRMQVQKNVTDQLLSAGGGFLDSLGGLFGGGTSAVQTTAVASTGNMAGFYTPAFASGGDFMGGLRLVGERGPELEATGAARIFNAQQTRNILSGAGNSAAPAINFTVINNASGQVTATPQQNSSGGIDLIIEQIEGGIARNMSRGIGPINQVMTGIFGLNRAAGAMR